MKHRPVIGHRKAPVPRHRMSKYRRCIYFIVIMDCQFIVTATVFHVTVKAFFDRIPLQRVQSVCAVMSTLQHKTLQSKNLGLEGVGISIRPVKPRFFYWRGRIGI